ASSCAATVGSAVQAVCEKLRKKVFNLARKMQDSPLADVQLKDVMFVDGSISLHSDPSRSVSIADAMRQARGRRIEAEASVIPNLLKQTRYTRHSHTAVFAEVRVDEDLGSIEVSRIVTAVAG